MNNIDEKYEALARYIEFYDLDNIPLLKFPKEDAEFLRIACERQVSKKPRSIKNVTFNGTVRECFKSGDCPKCNSYVDTDDDVKFCTECGQKLEWE